jgi:hypothetical protein
MVQNKAINDDDIVSVLDCVDENVLEVKRSDSDNKIGGNQESYHKSGISDSEQRDRKWLL